MTFRLRKSRLIAILLLYTIFSFFSTIFVEADTENVEKVTKDAFIDSQGNIIYPVLQSEGAVLINADTGEVLFEKNKDMRLYPASTTKVMTAILALEHGNLDDTIYFSKTAIDSLEPFSSNIGAKVGESMSLRDALFGLMISSGNEVGTAIAEYISGTVDEFCVLMNQRAAELGALNTHFANPHGLHNDDHYTTAYDLALIFQQGTKYPFFNELVKAMHHQIPPTEFYPNVRNLYSRAKIMMPDSPYYYEYCEGGKTGFTDQAMYTFVSHAENNGLNLIAATMKAPMDMNFADTKTLFKYGFEFFRNERIFDRYSYYKEIPVFQQNEEEVMQRGVIVAQAKKGVRRTLRTDILDKGIERQITIADTLEAPINKGDLLGKIELVSNGEVLEEVPLYAINTVTKLTPEEIKEMKKQEFIEETKKRLPIYLAFIPITIIVIIVTVTSIVRYRRKKRSKNMFASRSRLKMK